MKPNIVLAQIMIEAAGTHDRSYIPGTGKHGVSIIQACERAAQVAKQPTLAQPAYLLLKYTWNDALDWAKEQLS